MTNREQIEKVVHKLGYKIGCYDILLDSLSKIELKKVLTAIEFESDTDVSIKRKKHVVEITILNPEVDFNVLTKEEFIARYGSERYDQD